MVYCYENEYNDKNFLFSWILFYLFVFYPVVKINLRRQKVSFQLSSVIWIMNSEFRD